MPKIFRWNNRSKYTSLFGLIVGLVVLIFVLILWYVLYYSFGQNCRKIKITNRYIKPGSRDLTIEQAINNQPVKIHQHLTEEWSQANFQLKPLKRWPFWQLPIKGTVVKQVVTLQPTLEKPDGSKELIPTSFAVYEYQIRTFGRQETSINFEDSLVHYLKTNKPEVAKTLTSRGYAVDNLDRYLQADNLRNLAELVGLEQIDQWLIESLKVVASQSTRTIAWQGLKTKQASNIKNQVWQTCQKLASRTP